MRIIKSILNKYFLIILMFLFFIIRLPFLDQMFLLHDERDIVFSGYSIAQTGKDLFGNLFPVNFSGISPNNPLFAIYFAAIWSFFIQIKSVVFARLPFVLISSLLIPLVYWLVLEITKDKMRSLLTTILFCFSPWIFHSTRLALDIPLAIVTLLGGMLLLLKNKKIPAYLLFFTTFYTYQGFRLLIPFLLIYCELFTLIKNKKNIKQFFISALMHVGFIAVLFATTFIIDPGVTQNRFREIIFFSQKAVDEVVLRRNTSIAPEILKKIMDNKITISLDYMLTNLIKGQDFIYLFKEGDYSAINGNTASGQFFFTCIALFFLGIASLGKKSHIADLYLIGFSFIGMIPSLLSTNGVSFSIRSMLSGIGFAYIIALGGIFGYSILKRVRYSKIIIIIVGFLLVINVSYVTYTYFFRRPITVSELFNENERTFSKYLLDHKYDSKIIYSRLPQDIYLSIAYLDNTLSIDDLQLALKNRSMIKWNNYQINKCGYSVDYTLMKNIIIAQDCLSSEQYDYFNDINNHKVIERIKYKDYSFKTAYFVIR